MNHSEGDSYRPRYGADPGPPPPLPADARSAMYHFQGNNGSTNQRGGHSNSRPRNNRPHRPFKFRAPPPSERPLFTQAHLQESSELTFGGDAAEDKFRNLDDLTDTDEADMDVSVDGEYADTINAGGPPSKRARINAEGDAAEIQPKWSNPDPYTALPPVDQDSRKKTNVVHLIRKARNAAVVGQKDAATTHDDNFISFDFDDDEGASVSIAPPDAPLGPRLGRHDVMPSVATTTLGKRTRDDFENAPLITPKYGQQHHSDGRVLQIWTADVNCDATPWVKHLMSPIDSAGVALHKEIVDFYDWVQPKDYEVAVRGNLLARLEQKLLRLHPGGRLEAFGSYAAGLYLPVGDMDLVYLERRFDPNAVSGGLPPKPHRRVFDSTAKFLREQHIARAGSVNAIWFAKVPIIKFIDNVSGLKVDLSFNNATGVIANQTFQRWRELYPAMPIITSVIKQFLMLRGLNDVASGGLGGFSVICLVTSLIQHMPQTNQPANIGQVLVEFFNLYGKLFNRQQVAIRLDPPGYVDVASYRPFQFNNDKPDRLKIIDPNRPENNISGGSNKIGLIFECFATAHDILLASLAAHESGHDVPNFLEQIVGGNFEAYDTQRDYLRELHIGAPGLKAPAVLVPPPPPKAERMRQHPLPPPPPPNAERRRQNALPPPPPPSIHQAQVPVRTRTSVSSNNPRPDPPSLANGSSQHANIEFEFTEFGEMIKRFKQLRPALAERADSATNMRQLTGIGGYSHVHVMQRDLDARERVPQIPNHQASTMAHTANPLVASRAPVAETDWRVMDWIRERLRRMCPNAKLDGCKSNAELAVACGYRASSNLFRVLCEWEKRCGLQEKIKRQKAALEALVGNIQVEASKSHGDKPAKKAKMKTSKPHGDSSEKKPKTDVQREKQTRKHTRRQARRNAKKQKSQASN